MASLQLMVPWSRCEAIAGKPRKPDGDLLNDNCVPVPDQKRNSRTAVDAARRPTAVRSALFSLSLGPSADVDFMRALLRASGEALEEAQVVLYSLGLVKEERPNARCVLSIWPSSVAEPDVSISAPRTRSHALSTRFTLPAPPSSCPARPRLALSFAQGPRNALSTFVLDWSRSSILHASRQVVNSDHLR